MTCPTRKLQAQVDSISAAVEFALFGLRTKLRTCVDLIDSQRPDEARELLLGQIDALDIDLCNDTVQ